MADNLDNARRIAAETGRTVKVITLEDDIEEADARAHSRYPSTTNSPPRKNQPPSPLRPPAQTDLPVLWATACPPVW